MESNDHSKGEIDLLELFATLWTGKYLIAGVVAIFLVLGSVFLHNADREYTVSMTLKPVSNEGAGSNFRRLGSLASFAGVSLPTDEDSDFISFQLLLKSEEVAGRLLEYESLVQEIFVGEWDEDQQAFRAPESGIFETVSSALKVVFTGRGAADYMLPNAARLANYISLSLDVSKNPDTGFLKLSMENSQPELMVAIMVALAKEADLLLKEKFVFTGTSALEYYQSKLTQAQSQEHREALVSLIIGEEQKLMLASRGGDFVAEPILGATTSLEPTSPNSGLFLVLSIFIGLIVGGAFVLIRNASSPLR